MEEQTFYDFLDEEPEQVPVKEPKKNTFCNIQ